MRGIARSQLLPTIRDPRKTPIRDNSIVIRDTELCARHAMFFCTCAPQSYPMLVDPARVNECVLCVMYTMFFLLCRGLEYVLDRDMVVDTTLVGTVLNGLSQASVCRAWRLFVQRKSRRFEVTHATVDVESFTYSRGAGRFGSLTLSVLLATSDVICRH